jgi:hypothetical protein
MSDIRTLDDRGFADGLVAIATGLMLGALYVAISWRLIAAALRRLRQRLRFPCSSSSRTPAGRRRG